MVERKDGEQVTVRVGDVFVVEGHNPRTHFDDKEMEELEESIRAQGILQPLLVRQVNGGGLALIAGERRLRAARKVLGEDGLVPVLVRNCGEAEAQAMAVIENTSRASMGPANESEGAHRLMLLLKGDKAEVSGQLGWTLSKLERRLALMRATAEVREALTTKKITLGHAELLAAVPPEKQNQALSTIIARGVTVAQLRKQIGQIANALEDAVFDKGECATCQYSSAQQRGMFDESLAAGYCTNSGCWEGKTQGHLDSVAQKLREDVPRVEVLKADGAIEPIKLVAEGPLGVGVEQAKSCRGCMNFGCTVSGLPGSVGVVEKSICFDATCHSEKVSDRLRAEKKMGEAAREAEASARKRGASEAEVTKAGTEAKAKVKQEAFAKASTGAISTRVKEYRLRVWRTSASKEAFSSADKSRDLLITLALGGHTRHIDQSKLGDALSKLAGKQVGVGLSVKEVGGTVAVLPEKVKATIVNAIAASAMANVGEQELKGALDFMGVQLEQYWSIDAEFLGLLTKSEIFAVCSEIGLVRHMGQEKFKSAMAGKKDELIQTILGVKGFDYKGLVPKSMRWDVSVTAEGAEEQGQESEEETEAGE